MRGGDPFPQLTDLRKLRFTHGIIQHARGIFRAEKLLMHRETVPQKCFGKEPVILLHLRPHQKIDHREGVPRPHEQHFSFSSEIPLRSNTIH